MDTKIKYLFDKDKKPINDITMWNEREVFVQWLEHVAGVGTPITIKLLTGGVHEIKPSLHYNIDCETCKEIAAYLARYHEGEVK